MQRLEAEIVITKQVDLAIERLTAIGCELEVITWPDEDCTTVVAVAWTELSAWDYFDRVDGIVKSLDPTGFLDVNTVTGDGPVTPGVTLRRVGWADPKHVVTEPRGAK